MNNQSYSITQSQLLPQKASQYQTQFQDVSGNDRLLQSAAKKCKTNQYFREFAILKFFKEIYIIVYEITKTFLMWRSDEFGTMSDFDHNQTPPSSFHRRGSARGSMRKLLPPVPDMDTQMSMSQKMIDRRTSTPKGNHSYGPFFLEYSILAEYNLLQKQKLPGVYVIPSSETSLCKIYNYLDMY